MAVGSGAGRWWVRSNGAEMAGGLRVRKREVRGWVVGQKYETEHLPLGYGRAVRNGGGQWCWEVVSAVEWHRDGGGAGRSQTRGWGAGCGPKTQTGHLPLGYRCAVRNGGVQWYWEVVGAIEWHRDGGGAAHSQM
jgi:hypothetical protein